MHDNDGNWIENFRTPPYSTEEEANAKIKAVLQFHVTEGGWVQNGEPYIEKDIAGKYVAVIPLKKPAEQSKQSMNIYR